MERKAARDGDAIREALRAKASEGLFRPSGDVVIDGIKWTPLGVAPPPDARPTVARKGGKGMTIDKGVVDDGA